MNDERAIHILTIEDPIEFLHPHKKATIHQRELHSDTPTFSLALRAALRQAPKVILVGEMRDRETIEIALEAAETGHLVMSTLHTIDAAKTVERIVGVFPQGDQPGIRTRLSKAFQYIVSQRLLPRADGDGPRGRCSRSSSPRSARASTSSRAKSNGKTLLDAMRDGSEDGMQHFDGEIERLLARERDHARRRHELRHQPEQPAPRDRRPHRRAAAAGKTASRGPIRAEGAGRTRISSDERSASEPRDRSRGLPQTCS